MNEKTNVYEANVIGLPPLRNVLGDVPTPDPVRRQAAQRRPYRVNRDLEVPVRRLIAHLEKDLAR